MSVYRDGGGDRAVSRQDGAHGRRFAVKRGDLIAEHNLIDDHTGKLIVIIDFGDVVLGDLAQHLLGYG